MVRFRQSLGSILSIPGVVSAGEGSRNGQRVVIVGVDDPSVRSEIPGTVDGMPVVIEVENRPGLASAQPPLAPPGDIATPTTGHFVQRYRPVPPGVSIGHVDVTAGTSSFVVTDGNSIFQLSNNHVLAKKNGATEGDTIIQPGAADGGAPVADTAGTLAGYVELTESPTMDVAWYEPSAQVTEQIINIDVPTVDPIDPEPGDVVKFAGRTSGVVEAEVDRVNAGVTVGTDEEARTFTEQFRLNKPLKGGDSGSPVVIYRDGEWHPAGVGFASTDTNGWCNYVTNVVAETGFSIVSRQRAGDGQKSGASAGKLALLGGLGWYLFGGD